MDEEQFFNSENNQDISEPVILKEYIPNFKRKDKDGFTTIYKCQFCHEKVPVNKKRMMAHKKLCLKRRQMKQVINQQNQFESPHQHNNLIPPSQARDSTASNYRYLQSELKQVKQKLNFILANPGGTRHQKDQWAHDMAQKAWRESAVIVGPLIISKLSQQISLAIENKMNPENISRSIKNNLVERLFQFDCSQLLISWIVKLEQSIQQLVQMNMNKRSETKSRDNAASKWICKYSEYELTTDHRRFINELNQLTKYKRTNVIRFYNKLLRRFSMLRLKQLPSNMDVYTFVMQRTILDISTIKNAVTQLYNDRKYELACDLWQAACMGLRRSESQRVFYHDRDIPDSFYQVIKVWERKNRNITTRYIPRSLILLMQLTNTSYPITQERFRILRDFCISRFSQFYGIRHLCITSIVTSLLNQSQIRIHKRNRTTIERYINMENRSLIEKVFSLPQFQKKFENKEIKYSDSYPYFKEGLEIEFFPINQEVQIQILEEDDQKYIDDITNDSLLNSQFDQSYIESQSIEEDEKILIFARRFIIKKYGQELIEETYSQTEALNYLLVKYDITALDVNRQLTNKGERVQFGKQLGIISSLTGVHFELISFKILNDKSFSTTTEYQSQKMALSLQDQRKIIVLTSIHNEIKFSQEVKHMVNVKTLDKLRSLPSRKFLKRKQQTTDLHQIYFYSGSAFCLECHNYLEQHIVNEAYNLKCNVCGQVYLSKQFKRDELKSDVVIIGKKNKKSNKNYYSLQPSNSANNLKEMVEKQFGPGSYSNKVYYSLEFPLRVLTELNYFSETTQKAIRQNRKNQTSLPLIIKTSRIPDGGNGIWATADIKQNGLILTYVGVQRTNHSVLQNNNSLFSLGFVFSNQESDEPSEIFIQPSIKLNAARFINGSDKDFPANSASEMGLCVIDDRTQIIIIICAIHDISKGQEILYEYGKTYPL